MVPPVYNYSLSPWTNSVELLESIVSPLLKVALHWMLVLLYSTDMLLKSSPPCLNSSLNSVTTLVRLRSSSCIPFISHSTLVIVPDREAQLNTGLRSPGVKTLPLEELSNTRKQDSSKLQVYKTTYHIGVGTGGGGAALRPGTPLYDGLLLV